ncbi:hypothetical protein RHS03_07989, partial [Rhizoctonia solani]
MLSVIPKAKGKVSRFNLVVGKANPFRGLSNDMKLLLSADSLFRNNVSSQVYTYGEIVRFLKTDSDSHMGNEYVDYGQLWEAEGIRAYPFARKTAKYHGIKKPLYVHHLGTPRAVLGEDIQSHIRWISLDSEELRIIKMEEDVPDSESESEKPNVVKEEFDSECDSETGSWLANL